MQIETSECVRGGRKVCQDAAAVFARPASAVLVVADGAGGMADGEVASRHVITEIRRACNGPEPLIDWLQVLGQIDHGMPGGQSTACVVEVHAGGLRGASVGDSAVGMLVGDDLVFPSAGQQRKPLLGSGEAVVTPFATPWDGRLLILGSDGFWDRVRPARVVAEHSFIDFAVLATALVEMVRLPSGDLVDDTAVLCARRKRRLSSQKRIDLKA